MKKSLTVLFSSAGRRVELLNCFRHDARELGLELRVLAADCDPAMSAACHAADASHAVPRCTDVEFIPRLRDICAAEQVDLLIPTIDPELRPLAEARGDFATAGTHVAVSDAATVAMARNKLHTADFLQRHGIPAPRTVPLGALLHRPDLLPFPVIGKRIDGSSSIGLWEAADIGEVRVRAADPAHYLAQEKWLGPEYTVNVFFDRAGRCRATVPHRRVGIRAGEVSKGVTERHPLLMDWANRLGTVLPGARGALCFQAIIAADGTGVVFEINARFGGGYPLAHRAGAPFSRWLLEEAAGRPDTAHNDWQEGVTMLRYDAAVFVHPGQK